MLGKGGFFILNYETWSLGPGQRLPALPQAKSFKGFRFQGVANHDS